jgi:hypothetical protein
MADHLELNIETLGRTLRKKASGFRHLARGTLVGGTFDRDFRSGLFELALDYDRQAAAVERGGADPSPSSRASPTRNTAMAAYRVRFFKTLTCHGKTTDVCQRSIDIGSAPSQERAIEAAKQSFARLENITEWFLHADYVEVDALPQNSSSGRAKATVTEHL